MIFKVSKIAYAFIWLISNYSFNCTVLGVGECSYFLCLFVFFKYVFVLLNIKIGTFYLTFFYMAQHSRTLVMTGAFVQSLADKRMLPLRNQNKSCDTTTSCVARLSSDGSPTRKLMLLCHNQGHDFRSRVRQRQSGNEASQYYSHCRSEPGVFNSHEYSPDISQLFCIS